MEEMKEMLVKIVGRENVIDDPLILSEYSQDKSFAAPIASRLVVKVHSADEVGEVIRWANETKTPLVPVSSGAPHYKGDTVPSVAESVIVDLSEMKKILGVSRRHRIAVIEPGVTYGELNEALAKEGMTISMPLASRDNKSVVGSILETEPRLNALHQWCNLDPLRCVEVTWGDGNRMFTGEAGMSPMDLEEQWKDDKWQWEPFGPMMLDFYRILTGAQGSMGIVTWASVRCEYLTEVHKGYTVSAKKLEDLIDFSYKVLRLRFSEEFFILNAAQLARLMAKDDAEAVELEKELPAWTAIVGVAGREILPKERVAAQEQDIAEIAQEYGLHMLPEVCGIKGIDVINKAKSTCGKDSWKDAAVGAHQDIFFQTTLDRSPEFVSAMEKVAEQEGYVRSVGVYLQPENMGTQYHCSFTLPYDPENKVEAKVTQSLFETASVEFSRMGAYYFRPYGMWSKLQLNKDAESYKVLQELKGIFDPNGIMNPGKLSNN